MTKVIGRRLKYKLLARKLRKAGYTEKKLLRLQIGVIVRRLDATVRLFVVPPVPVFLNL